MTRILPTLANEPIGERLEISILPFTKHVPTQSVEKLEHLVAHRPEQFVYEHDRCALLFVTIYGWKQEDIFL